MSYELEFHPDALDEWKKLPKEIKEQFKKIIKRRQKNPHIPKARLRGNLKNYYKITLLKAGQCLIYQVTDKDLTMKVIAVGKRENKYAYMLAENRNN